MDYHALEIPDVVVIEPARHDDSRGFFSELYNRTALQAAGIDIDIVQENFSLSAQQHTVRGLHFQLPPFAQGKLVQVVKGRILDVAVDVRAGSPSYGRHVAVELSRDNWRQLWIPAGFAHGFCTLEPDTEVIYRVTAPYSPEHDSGIRWDDPALGIDWPVTAAAAQVSDKDRQLQPLAAFDSPFTYGDEGR